MNVDVSTTTAGKRRIAVRSSEPAACCAPLTSAGMSASAAGVTASLFKALADPHRVRIVNLLANQEGPVCVCDITSEIGLAQPTTSFHLKKLMDAGLLDREQRGTWAYYSLRHDALQRLEDVFSVRAGGRR